MVGPVIYTFGNAEQKQKFLPRILSGEDWWCQGYSEPGSGSDLASVRTKAVRDGDHYIVNGHKTWTTLAQHADWIFCLVRTDPTAKAQSGISFLMAGIGRSTRYIEKLKKIVRAEIPANDPEHLEFVKDIARVELDVLALEATELRVVAQMARGIDPGPAASLFKIRGTEIFQSITELTHRAIGNYGLAIREHPVSANHFLPGPDDGHTASEKYLNSRKLSIYGGSNEIQRNIIAKAVLGL
jgi:alkylation response protein AidB-like acyl-CoA dehydrogenase